jgi:DNA repair and recombination protein RAD54B
MEESDYQEEQDVGWRRRVVVGGWFLDVEGFGWEKVLTLQNQLSPGDSLRMGNKELEVCRRVQKLTQIDTIMSKADYLSGKSFINTTSEATAYQPATAKQFNPPSSTQTTIPQRRTGLTKKNTTEPRHDPSADGAIVLARAEMPQGTKPIDVVMDPLVARHLRPHQKEGVKFLYECVMGIKAFNGRGAILADEMGLGKTLTVIALIWTLLSISLSFQTN